MSFSKRHLATGLTALALLMAAALSFRGCDRRQHVTRQNFAAATATPVAPEATPEQSARVLRDIEQKRAATRYLHLPPLLVDPVPEIAAHEQEPA